MAPRGSRISNGCRTCRERHMKCDQHQPVCHNCSKGGRQCKRTHQQAWPSDGDIGECIKLGYGPISLSRSKEDEEKEEKNVRSREGTAESEASHAPTPLVHPLIYQADVAIRGGLSASRFMDHASSQRVIPGEVAAQSGQPHVDRTGKKQIEDAQAHLGRQEQSIAVITEPNHPHGVSSRGKARVSTQNVPQSSAQATSSPNPFSQPTSTIPGSSSTQHQQSKLSASLPPSSNMPPQQSNRQAGPSAMQRPQQPSIQTTVQPTHSRTPSLRNGTPDITDLYKISGEDPPTPRSSGPLTETAVAEIRYYYIAEYASGLDAFFETKWYSTSGLNYLFSHPPLCEMLSGMLDLFEQTHPDHYDAMRRLPATEARMVWNLMRMPRDVHQSNQPHQTYSSPPSRNGTNGNGNTNTNNGTNGVTDPELQRILNRLSIFESLMTGASPSGPPHQGAGGSVTVSSDSRFREESFWRGLGQFVAHHTSPAETSRPSSSHATSAAEVPLRQVRQLLDQKESRDVLYSIAVVRHIGFRLPGFPRLEAGSGGVGHLGEGEAQKLMVAKMLLEDEASGEGTNQVVQRVCAMAVRSWSLPR